MTELTEMGLAMVIACAVCLAFVTASQAWAMWARDARLFKRCERAWWALLFGLCIGLIIAIVGV